MLTGALKDLLDGIFGDAVGAWALMGGHAANLYRREIRTTVDVDILVPDVSVGALGPVPRAVERLRGEGWTIKALPPGGWLLRATHPEHGGLDLVVAETEYQSVALARADESATGSKTATGSVRVKALTVEDVLIHKLIANRAKDEADVIDILKTGPDLDQDYLRHWLGEWEVADRYEHLTVRAAAEVDGADW